MKSVARSFLITMSIGTLFSQTSQAMFASDIFTYDDKSNAKGLHVSLKGPDWQAKDVTEQDIPFHQQLFSNSEVMAGFADGQIREPAATEQRLRNMWIPRFQNGQPHGGLTVFNPENQENFGHIVAGGGDGIGVSEIAYSYMPHYWRKGIGSAVLGSIVQQWGPEVRRIGLGTRLDELQDANIIKAFKCFGGKELNRFDATASPSNPGSWKILDKFDFKAASFKVENPDTLLNFDNKEEFQQPKVLEEELLKLFDSTNDKVYKVAARYHLIDPQGKTRTFSKHEKFDRIKYHFEYSLQ